MRTGEGGGVNEVIHDGKRVDFCATDRGDWWTLETFCGPSPRVYAIRKETGELFELPDDRCPFVVFKPLDIVTSPPV
jgi:hypothetical protein